MATEVAEAAGHAAEHALTPSAYIAEHLQNFNSIGGKQTSIVDFSVINWDTMFWSVLMGLVAIVFLGIAARRVTSGVPGRFQAFVELVVEMVDDQAKGIVAAQTGLSPEAAFDLLRKASMQVNTKLHDVAGWVVTAATRHARPDPAARDWPWTLPEQKSD